MEKDFNPSAPLPALYLPSHIAYQQGRGLRDPPTLRPFDCALSWSLHFLTQVMYPGPHLGVTTVDVAHGSSLWHATIHQVSVKICVCCFRTESFCCFFPSFLSFFENSDFKKIAKVMWRTPACSPPDSRSADPSPGSPLAFSPSLPLSLSPSLLLPFLPLSLFFLSLFLFPLLSHFLIVFFMG